jgi:hypothetical protein
MVYYQITVSKGPQSGLKIAIQPEQMEESMKRLFCVLSALLLIGVAVVAGDSAGHEMSGEMPPMGPPAEMKELAAMVGTWDVHGKMRMDPKAEWTDYAAVMTSKYVCGDAAILSEYSGPMMGMTFEGLGLMTYDREKSEWQSTWTDNMAARTALYTGQMKDGKTVLVGEEVFGGVAYLSRITTYDVTEQNYKWQMESSMDGGENWYTSMEATYTKR